jgi:acetyl esterase/lipase
MYVRYDPDDDCKTGAIILVIPGGNYDESSINGGEGQPVAQWFVDIGITAVVLQYRCVSTGHYWPAQFEDWEECARQVKEAAPSWGCDPDRMGVIGFSAGGHLAAYAALKAHPDIKPKLQILVYPAIDTLSPYDGDMDPWRADQGHPAVEASIHLLAHADAPPAFLAGIAADRYTPAEENTDVYAKKLDTLGVPCEYVLNEDEEEDHGCGLQDWWTEPCAAWLRKHGWA